MRTMVPKITLRNARAWAPRTPVRWFIAAVAFVVALTIRLLLHEDLGTRFPLLFFTMATLIVHFFYGLLPAVLVAGLSLPTGLYFFVPPFFAFTMPTGDDLFIIIYYVISTIVFMILIQYLRRAQYQAVLLSEIAESRYLMLLDSEADRSDMEDDMAERPG